MEEGQKVEEGQEKKEEAGEGTEAVKPEEGKILGPDGEPANKPPEEPKQEEVKPDLAKALLVVEHNGYDTIGVAIVADSFTVPEGVSPELAHLHFPFILHNAFRMVTRTMGGSMHVDPFGPFELLVGTGSVRNAMPEEAEAFREWALKASTNLLLPRGPLPPGQFPIDKLSRRPPRRR